MNNNLRQYIRLLIEAAVSVQSAAVSGLALYLMSDGQFNVYVLYDPKLVNEVGSLAKKLKINPVKGYIAALIHQGECNNSLEIRRSAAEHGLGPLMYDIVMVDGSIIPDRMKTSSAAANVWNHYATKRSDVTVQPLDDEDNPKTLPPVDDCAFVKKDSLGVLNYSYSGGTPVVRDSLLNNHEQFVSTLEERGIQRKVIENLLTQAARDFFQKKFKG